MIWHYLLVGKGSSFRVCECTPTRLLQSVKWNSSGSCPGWISQNCEQSCWYHPLCCVFQSHCALIASLQWAENAEHTTQISALLLRVYLEVNLVTCFLNIRMILTMHISPLVSAYLLSYIKHRTIFTFYCEERNSRPFPHQQRYLLHCCEYLLFNLWGDIFPSDTSCGFCIYQPGLCFFTQFAKNSIYGCSEPFDLLPASFFFF